MEQQSPTITIVIPVYNDQRFLPRCLDSILQQTFISFEAILINDGSTDNSLDILEEYAKNDPRIKVYSQNNQGPGVARNYGISLARGEYIGFVDSDDFIEPQMLEFMYKHLIETNSDIVVCQFKKIADAGEIYQSQVAIENFQNLISGSLYSMVWNKLFRKKLFDTHQIHFPTDIVYEDVGVLFKLYFYASKIEVISDTLYFWYERLNSRTETISIKHLESMFFVFKEIERFLYDNNVIEKYEINFSNRIARNMLLLFERIRTLVKDLSQQQKLYIRLFQLIEESKYFDTNMFKRLEDLDYYLANNLRLYFSNKVLFCEYDREKIKENLFDNFIFYEENKQLLERHSDHELFYKLFDIRKRVYLENLERYKRRDLSKNFNYFHETAMFLKTKYSKIAIYGNGTIGRWMNSLLGGKVVAIFDLYAIESTQLPPVCNPNKLSLYHFEVIVVCVLGREHIIIPTLEQHCQEKAIKILRLPITEDEFHDLQKNIYDESNI